MSSDPIDTRTKILEGALALLEAQPEKLPRMTDFAKRAGISRQAVYLHFTNRLELLVAATKLQDQQNRIDDRLAASRTASSGKDRLDAFVTAWGSYIPIIYPVARALIAISDTDEEARAAWEDRMQDMREGCAAAVQALRADCTLPDVIDAEQATDFLWTLLSVRNWEQLTQTCGWSQECYLDTLRALSRATLAGEPQAITEMFQAESRG